MRKHFLLLFLMALLPLAGWATDVTVTLYDFTVPYGTEITVDNLPTDARQVTGGATWDQIKDYLQFSGPSATTGVGTYDYTLTKTASTGGYTIFLSSNNAKMTITKADNAVKTAGVLSAGGAYVAAGYDLVTTAPVLDFGTVKYMATTTATVPAADADGWSTTIPHETLPATYYVYIMAEADPTGNFNALAPQEILASNSVVITGTEIPGTGFVEPTALSANINFDNADHALLANGGSVDAEYGVMMYSLNGTDWNTSVPTAKNVYDYTVYWKIEPTAPYYEKSGNKTAKIVAVAPTVENATGATNLVWDGGLKDLLSAAGTASLGATPKYKISSDNGQTWGPAVAYANVQATAAGDYKIKTVVEEEGNYLAAEAAAPITVTIGTKDAYTSAPTAKAGLVWSGIDQQLIEASAGTVNDIVQYKLVTNTTTTQDWTTDITKIKAAAATNAVSGTAAVAYHVYYKVDAANYTAVAETEIANVKINKKGLSVKVNNVKKTYDGGVTLFASDDAALDGATEKFTMIGRIETTVDFSGITYAAIDAANKNVGEHKNVLTIAPATLNGISTNYEYTVIPGDLNVNKKALTITANQPLSKTYLEATNIAAEYSTAAAAGVVTGETYADVFTTNPILTTTAGDDAVPGDYPLDFTPGVLVANPNYTVSYVIPDGANFRVNPDPASKIVITVLPKEQFYTGQPEDWTGMVEGIDYYVTGLIGNDVLTKAPTFSRSNSTVYNAGTYDLIASGAEVANMTKYPGGFVYNNSTFKIKKVEVEATVNQQTVSVGATTAALDQNAWSVTGLVNDEDKSVLNGTLTITGSTATAGTVTNGITLSISADANYTLKAGSEGGKLLVISTADFALNPTDANLVSKLDVANDKDYKIVFSSIPMKEKEWYAIVLPFTTTPAELVKALGQYVVCNHLDTENSTDQHYRFKLEMDELPAGVPFLIKPAKDLNWSVFDLGLTSSSAPAKKTIKKDITPVTAQYQGKDVVTFTGTYATNEVLGVPGKPSEEDATITGRVWWLSDTDYAASTVANDWRKPKNKAHALKAMEAYLIAGEGWTTYSPNFTVEDFDGQTTTIKTLNAERINNLITEGWYTLNGVKLQSAPTQKGVYINNGKKVVIR